MANITSATAVLTLSVPDLLPAPTRIQGFSTDDIFSTASIKPIETQMGLDGELSAGFLFVERHITITLMAGSISNDFFDQLMASQQANVQPFNIQGVITLQSINKSYSLINGYMTGFPPISDAKKVLQPRKYELVFQDIVPIPVGDAG